MLAIANHVYITRFDDIAKNTGLQSLQHLKKEGRDDPDYLHADKHQSFLQIDILSFLVGLARHAQSSQTSLHYLRDILRKKFEMKFIFLHAGKHQRTSQERSWK